MQELRPIKDWDTDSLILLCRGDLVDNRPGAADIALQELLLRGLSQDDIDRRYTEVCEIMAEIDREIEEENRKAEHTLPNPEKTVDFFNLFKIRDKFDITYQNFVFIGLVCLILLLGQQTMVPMRDVCVVAVSGSLAVTFLWLRFYVNNMGLLWAMVHNLSYGIVALFLLVLTNNALSVQPQEVRTLPITEMHVEYGYRHDYLSVTVEINGRPKRLKFGEDALKYAIGSDQVDVLVKDGFWGYPIIRAAHIENYDLPSR
ncbi:MAG: hypothetical protein LBU95_02970 [Rikenellaceae bacterium]|jgi:hypothetical protein|nr:hypothetical protein [Rikenellaceae bacterium]